jgi:hypothetical protein
MVILTEANSPLSTRALWQPPVVSGGPVNRGIFGSHQYCPAVQPSEIFLERVGERAKEMRI